MHIEHTDSFLKKKELTKTVRGVAAYSYNAVLECHVERIMSAWIQNVGSLQEHQRVTVCAAAESGLRHAGSVRWRLCDTFDMKRY